MSRAGQRGQSVVLYAAFFLLLTFATFLTFSVGARVREKIKVQNAADTAAYDLSVNEARAFNLMAWANRAIVSEYVSLLSVAGHESFLNYWDQVLHLEVADWGDVSDELGSRCGRYRACKASCPAAANPAACMKACDPDDCLQGACQPTATEPPPYVARIWQNVADQNGHDPRGYCDRPPLGRVRVGSAECADAMYHSRPEGHRRHFELSVMENEYIARADAVYKTGAAAYDAFHAMAAGSGFQTGVGRAVDRRMDGAYVGQGTTTLTALEAAVDLEPPDRIGWDTYQEILTGTRTNFILDQSQNSAFTQGYWLGSKEAAEQEIDRHSGGACRGLHYVPDTQGGAMTVGDHRRNGYPDVAYNAVLYNHPVGGGHEYEGGKGNEGGRLGAIAETHGQVTVTYEYPSFPAGNQCSVTASRSVGVGDNFIFQEPGLECHQHSFDRAGDGHEDRDPAGMRGEVWMQHGIGGGNCTGKPWVGISVGTFHFNIAADETTLWNQPRTYAALKLDTSLDEATGAKALYPWDFEVGRLGGSLLTVRGGDRDERGGAREVDPGTAATLAGKGYTTRVFPEVRGLSHALTYFHNPLAWREVPSLWNPFWRAKLDPESPTPEACRDYLTQGEDDCRVAEALGYVPHGCCKAPPPPPADAGPPPTTGGTTGGIPTDPVTEVPPVLPTSGGGGGGGYGGPGGGCEDYPCP